MRIHVRLSCKCGSKLLDDGTCPDCEAARLIAELKEERERLAGKVWRRIHFGDESVVVEDPPVDDWSPISDGATTGLGSLIDWIRLVDSRLRKLEEK